MNDIETKHKDMKEKILNALDGKFYVTNVEREYWDNGIGIVCEFMFKGISGEFSYTLEGGERGTDNLQWAGEEGDSDLYGEIGDWVNEHIEWHTIIKWDDKEVK